MPPSDAPGPTSPPTGQRPSFLRVAATVFWSFFGVRRRRDHDLATASVRPIHIVVAGLVGGLIFVVGLVLLVRLITSS